MHKNTSHLYKDSSGSCAHITQTLYVLILYVCVDSIYVLRWERQFADVHT